MIAVQIIFIAFGALLAGADECSCRCNKQDVCDEQKALKTKLDNNTDEFLKFGRYYNFVKYLSQDWEYQVDHFMRQQLEVQINKTVEGLRNASQNEVTKQNMMARMESLESSVRALDEQGDDLDWTMEILSQEMSEIRTELLLRGSKCGVDFNNGGENTSSVLVWPWMAAVYQNDTRGYRAYACGGSVIHRHFVLTSADCVNAFGSDGLSVKLGLSDLKNGTHLREHRVQSTHIHPQFKTRTGYWDRNHDYGIALLELEEPIPFSPFVWPVCLPPPEIPQDESFYKPQSIAKAVYLHNYLSSPEIASPIVFNLTVHSQEECRRIKKGERWEKYFPSPDLSFCAECSPPICTYTGSPVMESRVEGSGTRTWTQVGIRNIHKSDCKLFFSPRLDHLRPWVDATIAASSKA